MKRVVILGAGFGGLELASSLSEAVADQVDVTLIDRSDAFSFGFAKLDVMFGHAAPEAIRLPYAAVDKPGVHFVQEEITAIDPQARTVTTDAATHEADVLVIAMGADYDLDATPGLAEGGNEFYSVPGAIRVGELLPSFDGGRVVIGVCGTPFKCPPAPSEASLLMHDYLSASGLRDKSSITFTIPFQVPVPPSPDASAALTEEFVQRDIEFRPGMRVVSLDPDRKVAIYDGGIELEYDLFLAVPKHTPPTVVWDAGLVEDGWVPVDQATLATKFPGVYAVGDVANQGSPKAGVFADGAAKALARHLIAELRGEGAGAGYSPLGTCYVEFGAGRVAKVNVDFSGEQPTGTFEAPQPGAVVEKQQFGATRAARWFGL